MPAGGFRGDEEALDAVVGVILVIVIALIIAAGIWFIAKGIANDAPQSAPAVGLVTDTNGNGGSAWRLRVQAVNRDTHIPDYILIVHTPQNGTLVARPVGDTGSGSYFWALDASDGTGTHAATSAPGSGGGFHLRYLDANADTRFNAGDRFEFFYDGDGDHRHASGADDPLPQGTYTFDLKHIGTDTLVASISRN